MALGPLKFLHRDAKWHESNSQNHAFIDKYVGRALQQKEKGQLARNNSKRPVLLDLMAEEMSDPVQLRNEATQAFIAAHETTACLISNIIYLLARYPTVWIRVREEALSIGDVPLDFDIPMKMKYLRNVINEGKCDGLPEPGTDRRGQNSVR
jgi:cytochrome P450